MLLTNLAAVARTSGLHVVEVDGWQDRGHGEMTGVESITCHHTATPNKIRGDYPTMDTIVHGRPGLDGPLAQLGLGRSGTVYVIAAGLCWHAGDTFYRWQSNPRAIGIEAEHPGGSTPWPDDQYAAYVRLAHALHAGYHVPVERVVGHKEIAEPLGRKNDPTFDMDTFRAAVARLDQEEDEMTPQQADRMLALLEEISTNVKDLNAQGRTMQVRMDSITNKQLPAMRADVDREADKVAGEDEGLQP